MIFDYRDTLRTNLEERTLRRPNYSLRAFARDLEVSVSRLSEVINNKKGTSPEKGRIMARNLDLSSKETEKFVLSIEALHSRSPRKREEASRRLLEITRSSEENFLNEDKFALISSWYHYAILELLSTESRFNNIEDIAQRMGLSVIQARQALERLEKLSLITKKEGHYKVVTETSFTTYDVPSEALKMHHKQNLELAAKSLYEDKVEDREIGSTTIAVPREKVGELKDLVRDFRRKVAAIADNSENKNSVYLLATQLFRLDKECNHG